MMKEKSFINGIIKVFDKVIILITLFILMINISSCAVKESDEIINKEFQFNEKVKVDTEYKPYTTMCFVGDIYFSNHMKGSYDAHSLEGIIDKNYYNILTESDINIGNLECAITDDVYDKANKEYILQTPVKYARAIKDVGFDLLTLANNHILDCGENGLFATIDVLKENNISYVGAGKDIEEASKPFITEINGKRYAIFSASSVLPKDSWKATGDRAGVNNGYDLGAICEDIRDIKNEVDKVIVYMHWGTELATVSDADEKKYAHKLVDFGADLIVGSHPHVVQEIEYYKGVPIVYSLGNFIYGATKKDTILLSVCFDYTDNIDGDLKLRIYPGISSYEQVKMYWKKEDMKEKCHEIESRGDTCYISPEGYVSEISDKMEDEEETSEESGEKEVGALATSSEIN